MPSATPPPFRDFSTYQPTAKATRIDSTEAPTIDGDLSDPVWAKAQAVDEFYQLEPDVGQPATERTVRMIVIRRKLEALNSELIEFLTALRAEIDAKLEELGVEDDLDSDPEPDDED
jgi:hypothetical protein